MCFSVMRLPDEDSGAGCEVHSALLCAILDPKDCFIGSSSSTAASSESNEERRANMRLMDGVIEARRDVQSRRPHHLAHAMMQSCAIMIG